MFIFSERGGSAVKLVLFVFFFIALAEHEQFATPSVHTYRNVQYFTFLGFGAQYPKAPSLFPFPLKPKSTKKSVIV